MDWMGQLGNILQRYQGNPGTQVDGVEDDYDEVARQAPARVLRGGLADAFRSDETPPFPQMFGQIFGRSGGSQRAGVLNMLISMLGPQILASILSRRRGSGGGGGILNDLVKGNRKEVTPEEADQIDPQVVEEMAAEAEKKDPSIIDNVSDFYAQHPMLVKGVGAVALAFLLSRISKKGPF